MKTNYQTGERVAVLSNDSSPYLFLEPTSLGYKLYSMTVETDVDDDGTKTVVVEVPHGEQPPTGIFVIEQTGLVTHDNYPIWRVVNE